MSHADTSTPIMRDIAEDMANDVARLDLGAQLGIAMFFLLAIAHRLPMPLQAETADATLEQLRVLLPRGAT